MVEALEKIQRFGDVAREEQTVLEDAIIDGNGKEVTKEHLQRETSSEKASYTRHMAADNEANGERSKSTEPTLCNPEMGNPISHGQIVELSQNMKANGLQPCQLEDLLKGARVYIPPPPEKLEPVRMTATT